MGDIILKKAVVRKPGYLYYIDGEGNICEAKLNRSGRESYESQRKGGAS